MTLHSTGNNGQLWRALAISLAVHALLLWPGAAQRLPERAAGALVATLRPVAEVAAPAPAPAVPPRSPASPRPRTPVAAAPAAVAPEPTFSLPAPPANTVPTGGGVERSVPVAAVPAPAVVAGGGGVGVDADGLRQYRLALAREARRFKRYPQRALQAGIGGTVEVRVELGAGAMPLTRLARSSGDESLDAAALDMVRQAALRTAVPESLRGRAFPVSLPVIFDAKEE